MIGVDLPIPPDCIIETWLKTRCELHHHPLTGVYLSSPEMPRLSVSWPTQPTTHETDLDKHYVWRSKVRRSAIDRVCYASDWTWTAENEIRRIWEAWDRRNPPGYIEEDILHAWAIHLDFDMSTVPDWAAYKRAHVARCIAHANGFDPILFVASLEDGVWP